MEYTEEERVKCDLCGEYGVSYHTLNEHPISLHYQKIDEFEELCETCFNAGMNLL